MLIGSFWGTSAGSGDSLGLVGSVCYVISNFWYNLDYKNPTENQPDLESDRAPQLHQGCCLACPVSGPAYLPFLYRIFARFVVSKISWDNFRWDSYCLSLTPRENSQRYAGERVGSWNINVGLRILSKCKVSEVSEIRGEKHSPRHLFKKIMVAAEPSFRETSVKWVVWAGCRVEGGFGKYWRSNGGGSRGMGGESLTELSQTLAAW